MRFGVCAGTDIFQKNLNLNADYIESSAAELSGLSDEAFDAFLNELKHSPLKCEVLNILFPGNISVVGPMVDMTMIKNYIDITFARAKLAGVKIIVFGSGRSRFCPEGFPIEDAIKQLKEVSLLLAETAMKYGLMIALEPLNKEDTNLINTVEEGLSLVVQLSHPNFKLLADFYHMQVNGEKPEILLKCKEHLIHTHIATKEGRRYPTMNHQKEFEPFFQALKQIGYQGRMSVEGKTDQIEIDAPIAMPSLREMTASEM